MSFVPKEWRDKPSVITPLDAAGLVDMETRLAAYADTLAAGGIEVDYAEIIAPATIVAPGSTPTDVPGLTVDVPAGPRPVLLNFFSPDLQCSQAARLLDLWLYDGTNNLLLNETYCEIALENFAGVGHLRLPIPTATKTFQIRVSINFGGAGNVVVHAGDGLTAGGPVPAYLEAIQV